MIKRIAKNKRSRRRQRQALLLSVCIHCVGIILLALWLLKPLVQTSEDRVYVELFVTPRDQVENRQDIPKPRPKPISNVIRKVTTSGVKGVSSAKRIPSAIETINPTQDVEPLDAPSMIENVTRLAPTPQSILNQSQLDGPEISGGEGPEESLSTTRGKSDSASVGIAERGKDSTGIGQFLKGSGTGQGYADLAEGFGKLPTLRDEIGDKLGGIIRGRGADLKAHIRIIRLKHSLSDWWQDPTAIPSLIQWLKNNTPVRADISFAGGSLPMTDPKILDAPLIIMTGHDRGMTTTRNLMRDKKMSEGFTDAERAALRKYVLERGGTLFFDDCGFKSSFANLVKEELRRIFPEYHLEKLPYDHELYKLYYNLKKPPEGGEVFWENENNAQPTRYKFHWGMYVPRNPGGRKVPNLTFKDSQGALRTTNRLGVIFNRKDYLCAMETAEIESRTALRLRQSTDVYRFMTNLMLYALKNGGNTDRSEYHE